MRKFSSDIFSISDEGAFNAGALEFFQFQYGHNPVYRTFTDALGIRPADVVHYTNIPFLPIGFFKTQTVYAADTPPEKIFLSSGTTGMERSRHHVADLGIYRQSLLEGFRLVYGDPGDYDIEAMMPSPDEAPDSSLVYMVAELKRISAMGPAGSRPASPKKRMLIGLTWALLDRAEQHPVNDPGLILIETGGMKGRRKEITREELHEKLSKGFGVAKVHSEYGMSELLSQGWSHGDGIFRTPPWMRILIRDADDPLTLSGHGKTGGINVIDLANAYSCPFIATQDLGKTSTDGTFEVLGRFDESDIRGCSLLA